MLPDMDFPFSKQTIAIIGLGLLGGSLGLAIKRRHPAVRIIGWARRQETIDEAVRTGAIDAGSPDPANVLPQADFSIICVPLQATLDFAAAYGHLWRPGSLVTDVGSVRKAIVQALRPQLAAHGVAFVGSHPMAGSHHAGIEHADAGLYNGATVFITGTPEDKPADIDRVEDFWRGLGTIPFRIDSEEHDALTARTSHALHLVAAAAVRAYLCREKSALATGGAFRDFSRIAGSSPDMWVNISQFNRDNLTTALRELEEEIAQVRQLIENGEWDHLHQYLDAAREQREAWFAEWSRRRR